LILQDLKKIKNKLLSGIRQKQLEREYQQVIGRHMLTNAQANELIYNKIIANKASFMTRFGSSELATIMFYRVERLKGNDKSPWVQHHEHILCDVSGFFPFTQEAMDQFSEMYLKLIPNIDMLGVWNVGEHKVADLFNPSIQLMNLRAIEPYYVSNP
jgi:hypothetical protein